MHETNMSKDELADALKEAKLLRSLKHENIVRYVESFINKGKFCLVMEYADGGDLYHKIQKQKKLNKRLSEAQVMNVLVQVGNAIRYLCFLQLRSSRLHTHSPQLFSSTTDYFHLAYE